jgi:transcription-repair coupling factor (superfamily II helicase)
VQDGLSVEFMILEFAEQAKLYVPLTRLDLIQKYRSTDTGPAPALNRLGSQQWQKTKARVRKAMQDMSAELLKLYAERHTAAGTAFSKITNFRRNSNAFDYNEIDDQTPQSAPSSTTWSPLRPWTASLAATWATAARLRRLQGRAGRQAGPS